MMFLVMCATATFSFASTVEKGLVEALDDKISETVSPEKRAEIANELKTKLNRKGEKAKLIHRIKQAETKIIKEIKKGDQAIIKEIKSGTVVDKADAQVGKILSEKNRNDVMATLKDAFSEGNEKKVRQDIANGDLTEKQKASLLQILDILHRETEQIPVEKADK